MAQSIPTDPQSPPPPADSPRGGGFGCLVPVALAAILAALLVAVALVLPPFNLLDRLFGTSYVMLDAQNNAARSPDESLTLILNPQDPGEAFGVALSSETAAEFASAPGRATLPANLTLASPVYDFEVTGTAPDAITLSITIPEAVTDRDRLDLYGYHADENRWSFMAAQPVDATTKLAQVSNLPDQIALFTAAAPSAPAVLVPLDLAEVLTPEVANVATIVTPGGLQPLLTGELTGSLAAGIQLNAGYRVMPAVRNFIDPRALDIDTVTTLISNRTLRDNHVQQIATFAGAYNGVFIDYRDLPADQRENFSRFIEELAAALDARNLPLGVVVPAAQNSSGAWETGAYDWQRIGAAADYVQVNLDRVDPTMFAPGADRLVEAMLRWGVGEVSRYKLVVGLSALSQRQASGGFAPIGYSEALSPLGNVQVAGELTAEGGIIPGAEFVAALDGLRARTDEDEPTQTSYIDYLDDNDNPINRVWLTTDEALSFRLNRIGAFGVAGAAFPDLAEGDLADGVLTAIANYKLSLPFEPTRTDLRLRWRIESAGGVVGESETGLNEALVATVDAPEGDYAVNVAVVAESETVRGGARIALAAPTATPTPLPTVTPRPTFTPTPTPDPTAVAQAQADATSQAVAAAPAGGSFGAVAPGAGSIRVGNFEYGGHVTSAATGGGGAMRSAGMTWMKVQIRFGPGAGIDDAANAIGGARAAGFKILLGTVGSPQDMYAYGDDQYFAQYAAWLAEVARLGPDAIEVWNEPNIDREWPTGQISGERYTRMLGQAYNAIKSANSGVMVISGAPAPTGAEAAYPGRVMNDDRWLREVVDAGGLQYMDCVGMHYNEGVTPPSARSGDPRGDNYYTRYFGSMLDVYWGIVGGQKPICITEIGYLTSEGYPSLPPYFSWASRVTVAQQAAWLAEAAAMASQSGRVRLFIVWNIDFTVYGSDPQGGYAIIRPDGSCPACSALANAR